jgi:tetratricopeptide (TPR) repeat protein
MSDRRLTGKVSCLFLIILMLLYLLSGCSMKTSFISYIKFWESDKSDENSPANQINRFMSRVRPPRGNPDAHYLLALNYQQRGKHKEALEEFGKVVYIAPEHVNAYNGMGISYDQTGNFEKAVDSYRAALKIDPKREDILNNLGYSYLLHGDYKTAIEVLQKALAINGKYIQIRNNLAMAYARDGQYTEAFNEFERAGGSDRAHRNMASLYFERGMFSEAIHHYQSAVALNPSDSESQKGMTTAELQLQALNAPVRAVGSESSVLSGQQEMTVADTGSIDSKSPSIEAMVRFHQEKGRLYYDRGLFDAAREHYAMVVSLNPANADARRDLEAADALSGIESASSIGKLKGVVVYRSKISYSEDDAQRSVINSGIEVSNGNGFSGMAKQIGTYLKGRGFNVVRLTNAPRFDYSEASIYYCENDYKGVAIKIAEQMPEIKNVRQIKAIDRPNVKVVVLVGRDLVQNRQKFQN